MTNKKLISYSGNIQFTFATLCTISKKHKQVDIMAAKKSLLIAAMLTGILSTSTYVEARVLDKQHEVQASVF